MVKGISRQVIVVHSPDPKLFEQAIFILKDTAVGQDGVTDEALLKEAKRLINAYPGGKRAGVFFSGPVWACCGALATGILWLVSAML